MSSFPLTNSYFSRWLLHHQPVVHLPSVAPNFAIFPMMEMEDFPAQLAHFLHSLWIDNLWNNHRNMMQYGITIDYKVILQCRICLVFQLQYALFVNTKGKIVCNWGMIFMMFNSVIQMLPTSHAKAAKEFYSQNTSPHCVLYPHDISPILVGWQAPQSSE